MFTNLIGKNENNKDQAEQIINNCENTFNIIRQKALKKEITSTESTTQMDAVEKTTEDELEAIGILTEERKQLRDKEAFTSATQEEKINILAKHAGLIDTE